jgi:V/A-type H+/Na+-transporting ATPase subunit D
VSAARVAVPPGRAGRLHLDRKLIGARRAADLLDRKLRILQAELRELSDQAARTEHEWHLRCAEAERTLLIAALLGGERAIMLATGAGYADVFIDYAVTIGVRRPASGQYAPPPGPDPWAGPHVAQARQAHRAALAAAVRHAAAAGAARIVEAEVVATRYRLRAVRDRLIPRLEQARAEVMLAIDEMERADDARLRRRNPSALAR